MASELVGQLSPFIGAICGAGFTLFLTRYQLRQSNRIERKEKWREGLSLNLAEFAGKCYALHLSFKAKRNGNSDDEVKLVEELAAARLKVFLLLDPNNPKQQALIKAMDEAVNYIFVSESEDNRISDYMKTIVARARVFTCEGND